MWSSTFIDDMGLKVLPQNLRALSAPACRRYRAQKLAILEYAGVDGQRTFICQCAYHRNSSIRSRTIDEESNASALPWTIKR